MMLGKRGRPPMRRTTSMTGITVDLGTTKEQEPSDYNNNKPIVMVDGLKGSSSETANNNIIGLYDNQYYYSKNNMVAMVSPRYHRRILSSSGYEVESTPNFLNSCGLCNRRLAPGRDIYMYRGDTAFCSMECREQQIKQDERTEKSNKVLINSKKKTENHHNIHSELPSAAANSETCGNGGTVAAA